jgi:hypothetical protein
MRCSFSKVVRHNDISHPRCAVLVPMSIRSMAFPHKSLSTLWNNSCFLFFILLNEAHLRFFCAVHLCSQVSMEIIVVLKMSSMASNSSYVRTAISMPCSYQFLRSIELEGFDFSETLPIKAVGIILEKTTRASIVHSCVVRCERSIVLWPIYRA